ncbi:unnamed protein product [Parajaminaea phylloscopi]
MPAQHHRQPGSAGSGRFASWLHGRTGQLIWRVRQPIAIALQAGIMLHLCFIHVAELRLCEGPSMFPTLSPRGDILLMARLPFARLLERWGLAGGAAPTALDAPAHKAWKTTASKWDRACGLPVRVGDLVVAASPRDPNRHVCKRVLGLPGDTVLFDPRATAAHPKEVMDLLHKSKDWSGQDGAASMASLSHVNGSGVSKSALVSPIHRPEAGDDDEGCSDDDGATSLSVTVPPGHVFLVGDNLSNSTDSRHYGPVPMGCLRGKVLALVWPTFKWFETDAIRRLPMAPGSLDQ